MRTSADDSVTAVRLCSTVLTRSTDSGRAAALAWANGLKIPLISDEAVNIDEEGLLTHEFDELLHERPQSRLRHGWHQLVVQAALPEQGVDAPFGGACFEMFVEAQSFASGSKQRQKRNCQCIEKP